ncbi:MAG: Hpt domain-containing protein [Bacteriovoracaceae bacterium]|nr:Hpt domain-containing protein [Bacteriovoracaceae bacterium]
MNADRFFENLKREFFETMHEHITQCEIELINFEQNHQEIHLENYKKKLHSIKGNASAMDEKNIKRATHLIETVCKKPQSKYFFDKNFKYIDFIKAVIKSQLSDEQKEAYYSEFLRQLTRSDS